MRCKGSNQQLGRCGATPQGSGIATSRVRSAANLHKRHVALWCSRGPAHTCRFAGAVFRVIGSAAPASFKDNEAPLVLVTSCPRLLSGPLLLRLPRGLVARLPMSLPAVEHVALAHASEAQHGHRRLLR